MTTSNPDQEGNTNFWYDRFGRIVISQNPVQADQQAYSYTLYDAQGRPVQTGQVKRSGPPSESDLKGSDPNAVVGGWAMSAPAMWEVTITTYDAPLTAAISAKFNGGQQNLRLRVASILYFDTVVPTTTYTTGYTSAIHYSYDPHGNVIEQLQDVPQMAVVDLAVKSTQYEFELISGNVKKVSYQKGQKDAFTHTYAYDRLNRLTEVFTSSDGVHQTREAHYRYYDHGPLARVETGQYQVQGQDYAYTINGWLKGMNASTLNNSRDMGKDGAATGYLSSNNTVHGYFAKDVTAYTLGYYDQDYKAAGSSTMEATYTGPTAFGDGATNLYNGNIRHLVTAIQGMTTLGHTYRYDQLQRLKSVNTFYLTGTGLTNNSWSGMTATPEYNSSYTYDPNGNLLTLNRNAYGAQLTEMDKLIYQYDTNPVTGKRWNRLRNAKETGNTYMTGSTPSYDDIRGGNNYFFYDKLGQLTKDSLNGIASVRWRLGDKKALVINHVAANAPQVKFIYDPFGRRIAKIVTPKSNKILQANRQFTYYALDANGQEMAVYTANINTSSPTQNTATLDEHYLYGAARLGIRDAAKAMYNNGPVNYAASSYYKNTLGKRNYELTNYLGNVQAVITDRRTYSAGSYLATLVMSADYYAFGMAMPGRTFNSASYRYGYNGMEKDDEVKSGGNSYTTEFRQYDPRVGRWLSLDPLMGMFPDMSPYVAFDNNPVYFTDPYGLSSMGPLEPEITEPEKNEVKVTAKKSISSQDYKDWQQAKGGIEFSRQVVNEIYQSKINALNNNGMGEMVYGTNAAGTPDYPQDLLDSKHLEAEKESAYAMHGLYAAEKSGVDPNGLNYHFNPIARASYRRALVKAASSIEELNGILNETLIDVATLWVGRLFTVSKGAGPSGSIFGNPLRAAYRVEVKNLQNIVIEMKLAGKSTEEIARKVHKMRRDIGVKYKNITPKHMLEKIYLRNLEKYGDKLGPTIDWLRNSGKSWDDIINSAVRTGGKDLGL